METVVSAIIGAAATVTAATITALVAAKINRAKNQTARNTERSERVAAALWTLIDELRLSLLAKDAECVRVRAERDRLEQDLSACREGRADAE